VIVPVRPLLEQLLVVILEFGTLLGYALQYIVELALGDVEDCRVALRYIPFDIDTSKTCAQNKS
jgi:hypothetical protein